MDEKNRFPNVPKKVIITVLNMYLENGTQEVLSKLNKSVKFFVVASTT